MDKNMVASRYAPLRHYVTRYARRLGRFLWDWLPDALVITVSVIIIMALWEICFWH